MTLELTAPSNKPLQLNNNAVHIWLFRDQCVDEAIFQDKYLRYLNVDEREKHHRFHFLKHRHQYLATRVLVKSVLSTYSEISPTEWRFSTNQYGRPFIANPEFSDTLYFNLSHTENMIALAVAKSEYLGIDVEWLGRDSKSVDVAEHYFSSTEIKQLFALEEKYKTARFFDLWTLKEAYIKARGMGLSIPLDSFSFTFPELSDKEKSKINIVFTDNNPDDPRKWFFWQYVPIQEYRLAVALKNKKSIGEYNILFRNVDSSLNARTIQTPTLLKIS